MLFIKAAQSKANVQELIKSIEDNPEQYNHIFKPFFADDYLREYCDAQTILELLVNIYYRYNIKNSKRFLYYFCKNFNKVFNEWVAIFPLDYNKIFSKSLTSSSFIRFGQKVLVIPSTKDNKLLAALLVKEYRSLNPKESLEDFHRRGRETLLDNPLLCIRFHGTRSVGLGQVLRSYRYFKWLQEVFVASVNKRNHWLNINQATTRHFYLFNLKKGEIESYPLGDAGRWLFAISDELFLFFKKKHMKFFIELIFNKIEDNLFRRLFNALYFFSKGFNSLDDLSRFIYYVFSMESLFTLRGASIATSLADSIALLCYPDTKRLEVYKLIKDIYRHRSDIVHSGKHTIDHELLKKTEEISSCAIVCSLEWFRKAKKGPNLEDKFFDYLLSLRLK